ncbi:AraC family transcriptional regulator [Ruminococcus sp.]|uniref:AraC family transcriptional regulator n=1 Tax=Ruminococcus sp. TaxID=41978 RepID=UPI00338EFD57
MPALRQASIRCPASDHLGNIPVGNRGVLRLSSQSHFIQCFQRETGLTPMEYRRKFYQRSEVSDSKNG